MRLLRQDSKYALRQLRKSPGFTTTVVLMLALGIGASTTVFSVVEGVLLRPLPFRDPGRLVVLSDKVHGTDIGRDGSGAVAAPEIAAYAQDTRVFESMGGYTGGGYELSGSVEPVRVNGARLGAGVFRTLGIAPALGRVFTEQEDGQLEHVAVLSWPLWQTRFHADRRVLGARILLDREPYTVIGVMPHNFEFPLLPGHLNRSELWVPLSLSKAELMEAGDWSYQIVARLKPGIALHRAQEDANRVAREIVRGFSEEMANMHISAIVVPLREDTVADARPLILTLFLGVAVVLLIVCANLAGLLLVRALRRRREYAVRLALGASSAALLRQALLESLLLSVSGGVLGIALAALALRIFVNRLPETLPRLGEIGLNWPVVAFALLLGVVTGALCGLAPAFAAIRTSLNESLKEGGSTGTAGTGLARLRSGLVVGEISIALVLLCASGLLLRSFERMRAVDLGFRPEHVVTANYSLPRKQYASQTAVDRFNNELLRRLRQLRGAGSVGLTSFLPTSGAAGITAFIVEGYVRPKGADMGAARVSIVLGDYFPAIGMRLLRGRVFTDFDKAGAPLVVVVNRRLAEHYWPGQDPIGKRLRAGFAESKSLWMTVVGEVADVRQDGPDMDLNDQYYVPVGQVAASSSSPGASNDINGCGGSIVLRTTIEPERMLNAVRSTVRPLDSQLPLTDVQTMNQVLSDSVAPRRFNTVVMTAFAAGAVLLAMLGVYSVIAFSVVLRVREVAIRMALGSQRVGIVRLILASGARLAAIGCVVGLLGAWGASRLLGSLLFHVDPFDPMVFGLAVATIFLLSIAASVIPARRAAAIDPVEALRTE
jgi:putative ABC transport system permease protein